MLSNKLTGDEIGTKRQTKIRRIYDVANILQSLGLMSKVTSRANKSISSFEWLHKRKFTSPSPLLLTSTVEEEKEHVNKKPRLSEPQSEPSVLSSDGSDGSAPF